MQFYVFNFTPTSILQSSHEHFKVCLFATKAVILLAGVLNFMSLCSGNTQMFSTDSESSSSVEVVFREESPPPTQNYLKTLIETKSVAPPAISISKSGPSRKRRRAPEPSVDLVSSITAHISVHLYCMLSTDRFFPAVAPIQPIQPQRI